MNHSTLFSVADVWYERVQRRGSKGESRSHRIVARVRQSAVLVLDRRDELRP